METFSNSCSINKVSRTKTTHHVRVQITDSYDDLRKKRYFSKYLRGYGKSIQVRQLMIRSLSQISMMNHTPNVIWHIKEPKMSMQLTCSSFWGVFAFAESFYRITFNRSPVRYWKERKPSTSINISSGRIFRPRCISVCILRDSFVVFLDTDMHLIPVWLELSLQAPTWRILSVIIEENVIAMMTTDLSFGIA